LTQLAGSDPSPGVRLYLASAMQRLTVGDRWPIGLALAAHAEDASDANLPLMIWYGMEPSEETGINRAIEAIAASKIPVLREFSARRITTAEGGAGSLVSLLASTDDINVQRDVLRGMNEALSDQREFPSPPGWAKIGPKLMDSADPEIRENATNLATLFGDPKAMESLRQKLLSDADTTARQRALQVLVQHRDPQLPELLQKILADKKMAGPALRALASCPGEQTPRMILEHYPQLTKSQRADAVNTLASRPEWATALLDAVDAGKIPRSVVSTVVIRQLVTFQNPAVNDKLAKVWGSVRSTAEDKRNLIARYKATYTPDKLANADLPNGRAVFNKTCAQCHTLFNSGGHVGPDLTGSQRTNLDYLFENVLDPSAVVAKEYLMTIVRTKDGRVINGIIQKETPAALTLRTPTEDVVLPKDEIEKQVTSNQSMMPEGLLEGLATNDARDLIAYLRSDRQVPLGAEKK
jgi:putative heme-binding domain-containing protein